MLKLRSTLRLAALVLVMGCARAPVPASVSGTVLLDGKGLGKASVAFLPVQEPGQHATTRTQEDGGFTVAEGLRPGEYKVVVVVDAQSEAGPFDIRAPGKYKKKLQDAARSGRNPVPEHYSRAETTPLRVTLPLDGPVRLELASKS